MELSFQSIGDELDDSGEVGLRTKKMGFNIRVGRFNSRGGLLVKVSDFFGESMGIHFCHWEPDSIQIILEGGRELRREGKEGFIELGRGRNLDDVVEVFEHLRFLSLVLDGFGEIGG